MKKVIRLVMSCLVLINVFMTTAFAAVPSPEVYTSIDRNLIYVINSGII